MPLDFFDEIVCIVPSADAPAPPLDRLGVAGRARRVPVLRTPADKRIGLMMTHRRLAQDMFERSLRSLLILESAIETMDTAADHIDAACGEIARRPWQVLHTGCWHDIANLPAVPGCTAIRKATGQPRGGGYALHITALPIILKEIPANFDPMQDWIVKNHGIESVLAKLPQAFVVSPSVTTLPMHLPYQPIEWQERFAA